MNEMDLFRKYDNNEDFKLCDLTPQDLQEIFDENDKKLNKFKNNYFDFYDDIKTHTKSGPQDW